MFEIGEAFFFIETDDLLERLTLHTQEVVGVEGAAATNPGMNVSAVVHCPANNR